MEQPPLDPTNRPLPAEPIDRRTFLQRLGKTVIYTVPVVTYLTTSTRAVATSGLGGAE